MPRVPVHTLDTAPAQTRPTLQQLTTKMGKLLNIHAEMAHSPVVLATYAAMQGAIAEHGTFDARTREAIALAVAAVDHCSYCQSAHTLAGTRVGLKSEETVAIRNGDVDFDERLGALLAVVREVVADVGEVSDATWKNALEAGWTDGELTESFAHIAVNMFTNYFNHMVDTELDIPAAPGIQA